MLYKILTGDRFLTATIIFLLALGIWMPAFLSPEIVMDGTGAANMPLYGLIGPMLEGNVLVSKLLAFAMLLFEAVMLVRINARYILVQQKTFLPALFFIIIASHSPALLQWNPVLPAAIFVMMTLSVIFNSYRDEPNSYRYFEAGMLLGLGSLFYAPLIYLLVFIWIAGLVQRPFYWREYVFPLLGLMVPFAVVFATLFILNKSIPEFLLALKSNFIFTLGFPRYHWVYYAFAVYLAVLIAIASVYLLKVFQFRKIYIRDYFMVLFWLFIIASLIFLFFTGFNLGLSYLIAISMSYLLTNYFTNAKKSLSNKLLFYLLLGFAVVLALV
jgi:hypothetical protein